MLYIMDMSSGYREYGDSESTPEMGENPRPWHQPQVEARLELQLRPSLEPPREQTRFLAALYAAEA